MGTGEEWEDISFDDPPAEMYHEWESFAKAIELGIEPPSDGNWGRQVMEVLFAAETSSITGEDVVLDSGLSWVHQSTGWPITTDHGWY